MPFLLPKQPCQSTESKAFFLKTKTDSSGDEQ